MKSTQLLTKEEMKDPEKVKQLFIETCTKIINRAALEDADEVELKIEVSVVTRPKRDGINYV